MGFQLLCRSSNGTGTRQVVCTAAGDDYGLARGTWFNIGDDHLWKAEQEEREKVREAWGKEGGA